MEKPAGNNAFMFAARSHGVSTSRAIPSLTNENTCAAGHCSCYKCAHSSAPATSIHTSCQFAIPATQVQPVDTNDVSHHPLRLSILHSQPHLVASERSAFSLTAQATQLRYTALLSLTPPNASTHALDRQPTAQSFGYYPFNEIWTATHGLGSMSVTGKTQDKGKKCAQELRAQKLEVTFDKKNQPFDVAWKDMKDKDTADVGQQVRVISTVSIPAWITFQLPEGKNWGSTPPQSPSEQDRSSGENHCTTYREQTFWAVELTDDTTVTIRAHAECERCVKDTAFDDDDITITFKKKP